MLPSQLPSRHTPFAVVVDGWEACYEFYDGYGREVLPSTIHIKGEEWLDSEFPLLSRVIRTRRVEKPVAQEL